MSDSPQVDMLDGWSRPVNSGAQALQLWSKKEPGLTRLVRPNRPRQSCGRHRGSEGNNHEFDRGGYLWRVYVSSRTPAPEPRGVRLYDALFYRFPPEIRSCFSAQIPSRLPKVHPNRKTQELSPPKSPRSRRPSSTTPRLPLLKRFPPLSGPL
jgi:hypothetical protein